MENFSQKDKSQQHKHMTSYGNDVENIALRVTQLMAILQLTLFLWHQQQEKTDSNTSVTKIILKDKYDPDEVQTLYVINIQRTKYYLSNGWTFTHKEKRHRKRLYNFCFGLHASLSNAKWLILIRSTADWANEFNLIGK
jgi:hypothetical protein